MMKQKRGSIINTASVGAILPGDRDMMGSIYDTAKAGIIVFSRKAAAEYGMDGIRVNALAPGMVGGTKFAAERKKEPVPGAAENSRPMENCLWAGWHGGQMKGMVAHLASDAASYATGQVFAVGGISIHNPPERETKNYGEYILQPGFLSRKEHLPFVAPVL
jgi:NAD(P)-dependent dehydrogenase (short-subunit alcohol dehydrogenase family)